MVFMLHFLMRVFPIIIALILLSSCSSQESKRLDASDLETLFDVEIEQRIAFSSFRFTGNVILRPDRTAHLTIPALGEDQGMWWLAADTICSKWNTALNSKPRCAHIFLQQDGNYKAHDPQTGDLLGTFEILP